MAIHESFCFPCPSHLLTASRVESIGLNGRHSDFSSMALPGTALGASRELRSTPGPSDLCCKYGATPHFGDAGISPLEPACCGARHRVPGSGIVAEVVGTKWTEPFPPNGRWLVTPNGPHIPRKSYIHRRARNESVHESRNSSITTGMDASESSGFPGAEHKSIGRWRHRVGLLVTIQRNIDLASRPIAKVGPR